jgi:3D (Asp-Asp-Asp) domain-containing protein/phage-related protein
MELGAKVGTAYVEIDGDFTPLERKLQALRAPLMAQGKEFGKSISAGMTPALAQVSSQLLDVGDTGRATERRLGNSFKTISKSVADSARRITDSVKVAGRDSRALGRDLTDAATGVDDAFSKANKATGDLPANLRVTKVATGDLAAAFSGLVGGTDDYIDGLARASGITVKSSEDARNHAAAIESLRDHNLALAPTFGALVGESGDFADELRRVGAEQSRATANKGAWKRFGETLQGVGVRILRTGAGFRRFGDDADGADRVVGRFRRSVAAAGGGIGNLLGGLSGLGGGFGAIGGAIAVGIPLLIGFGGATFALGAALAPLSGLAAAAAVGLTAAATGAGVFALASMGVGDAIKEQLTAHGQAAKAATSSAVAQRAAARAIQSAEDGVADAKDRVRQAGVALAASHRSELAATEALTEASNDAWVAVSALFDARTQARRNIEDLTEAVADGALAESRATSTLRDARKALTDLQAGASADELADAHNRVTSAVLSETRATQALEDAHQALADLLAGPSADDTADAHEKISDAQREQEKAVLALKKAQADAQKILDSSTATDDEKAQARLDLADAEDRVGDATTASARAQKDLNALEAGADPKKVQRARTDIAEAEQRVAEARRGSGKAQEDLAKLEAGADPHALEDARLAIAEAENALADAIRDHKRDQEALTKAEKDGVKNAPEVVAARQALADANERVEDAVQGVTDAHRAAETADKALVRARRDVTRATQDLSDAQDNAAAGTAAATSGAQDLNKAFNDLPPAAQAFVRQIVALKPKLDELRATAAQGLFPGVSDGLDAALNNFEPVKKVVGETADALGDLARDAGELVGSPAFGKDIETIGGRNAKIIGTLGDAALHVVSAIRHILVAAGPLTSWLAKTADGWAKNADESAKAGRKGGELAGFFEKTRSVLERLGSITSHVAHGLLGVGKAAKDSGDGMLKSIGKAAKRFDEWANSTKGQSSLKEFFEKSKELIGNLVPVLEGVGKATAKIGFGPLSTALKIAGPHAETLTYAFIGYKTAVGLATVANTVYTAGQWLLNAAMDANPVGLIVIGIAALAAGFIYAYKHSETFRGAVDAVVGALKDAFGWVKENWQLLLAILTGPFGLAVLAISKHADDIKSALDTAWSAIKSAAKTAWDGIKSVTIEPVGSAVGWIKEKLGEGKDGLVTWLGEKWSAILTGAGTFAGSLKEKITEGFRGAAKAVAGFAKLILKVIDQIPGVDMKGAISGVDSFIKGIDDDGKKDGAGKAKTSAYALGGAYARTGGVVAAPITLMGEEAPLHPEFVIPTNPAYRKRAQDLVRQAADAVGFANGGVYVSSAYGPPWTGINGTGVTATGVDLRSNPHVLGVAVDPSMIDLGSMLSIKPNPFKNTSEKFKAFDTGSAIKGPRIDFYDWRGRAAQYGWGMRTVKVAEDGRGGGVLKALGGAVSGAAGSVSSAVSDLVSKGAGFLLDQLPGVGDLPDWLKGTGKYLLTKATGWIKDKVGSLIPGGGGGGGSSPAGYTGPPADEKRLGDPAWVDSHTLAVTAFLDRKFGLTQSSGYRSPEHNAAIGGARGSHHTRGSAANPGATDSVGPLGAMNEMISYARQHVAGLVEAMVDNYAGLGNNAHLAFFAKGGMYGNTEGVISGPFLGTFHSGGVAAQDGFAYVQEGERMIPRSQQLDDGDLSIEALEIYIGGERIDERVDVRIRRRERESAAEFRAGVV